MLRNYLAAALRNLVRNRLYAALNIVGLAVGFAAALLIALFVRGELAFERNIAGSENAYHLLLQWHAGANPATQFDRSPPPAARILKAESPAILGVTRIFKLGSDAQPVLRNGTMEGREDLLWADSNFFAVLPMASVAGDLASALSTPDSIVITRAIARKYFGRDDPIGETVELDRKISLRVTAVLEDLPPETHLHFSALVSGLASVSPQTAFEGRMADQARNYQVAYTYFQARPGTPLAELQRAVQAMAAHPDITPRPPLVETFTAEPISDIHLRPASADALKPSGGRGLLTALAAIAVLIVAIAGINFINLMAARSMRRAVEVGIRKVSGAERRSLIVQFIGEAMLYALAGVAVAVLLAAALLPAFNAFVDRTIRLRLSWGEWAWIAGVPPVFGIVAGFYPALVLSAFSPGRVLSGGKRSKATSESGRRLLVAVQFAIFVGLTLAGGVIWRQTQFGMKEGLRLDTDAVVVVSAGGCTPAFRDAVRALPGVRAAGCSMGAPLEWFSGTMAGRPGGTDFVVGAGWIDFGLLETYGLKPLAGRFFDPEIAADVVPPGRAGITRNVVVNETAVRDLGFSSPEAAIGQTIYWESHDSFAQIIGVAPDTRLAEGPARDAAPALGYVVAPGLIQRLVDQSQLHIKLTGRSLPETLEAIDGLWRRLGPPRPIARMFVDAKVAAVYATVVWQAQVFGVFSAIALFVACLGLFGLAAFTAELRTKEIGIRKAMGASKLEILRLLLWQFTKPVLWANVLAWPAAYLIMRRWLQGFAYHIDLAPWMFLAASALALSIAVLTVIGHALIIARAQPVAALRYE